LIVPPQFSVVAAAAGRLFADRVSHRGPFKGQGRSRSGTYARPYSHRIQDAGRRRDVEPVPSTAGRPGRQR
jgi:hypothetical protein